MSVTKKQKKVALEEWGDNYKVPLPKNYEEWVRKDTARYIYIDRNGTGFCSRCESKVMLPKTKHLGDVKCPSCGRSLKAMHVWRRSRGSYYYGFGSMQVGIENNIDWRVFVDVLSKDKVMFRYVLAFRPDAEPYVSEKARMILDFNRMKMYTLEYWTGSWHYSAQEYFRECGMGYSTRRFCCLGGSIYPYHMQRLNRLEAFENIKFSSEMFRNFYPSGVIITAHQKTNLYEKLSKVGLYGVIRGDLGSYSHCDDIQYDEHQTSLIKMLRLNKSSFRMLKQADSIVALRYLQKNPTVPQSTFDKAKALGFDNTFDSIIEKYRIRYGKTYQYVQRHGGKNIRDFIYDYRDYLNTIDSLGYPFDNQYLYPKDFRKADERVNAEYKARQERLRKMTKPEQIREQARIDATVNKISELLRQNEGLKRWMVGSSGLKVIVPSSVAELVDEGIQLHNCLQTYDKAIANKQSLIFFIRKINEPDKAYIAMEYKNGKLAQLRLNNNESVKDAKIISFADAFVKQLNKADIMNEIRRAA